MKRRVEVRIDELRLPPGSRGSIRARDAIVAAIARALDARASHTHPAVRDASAADASAHDAIATAVRDGIAPHVPSGRR